MSKGFIQGSEITDMTPEERLRMLQELEYRYMAGGLFPGIVQCIRQYRGEYSDRLSILSEVERSVPEPVSTASVRV